MRECDSSLTRQGHTRIIIINRRRSRDPRRYPRLPPRLDLLPIIDCDIVICAKHVPCARLSHMLQMGRKEGRKEKGILAVENGKDFLDANIHVPIRFGFSYHFSLHCKMSSYYSVVKEDNEV